MTLRHPVISLSRQQLWNTRTQKHTHTYIHIKHTHARTQISAPSLSFTRSPHSSSRKLAHTYTHTHTHIHTHTHTHTYTHTHMTGLTRQQLLKTRPFWNTHCLWSSAAPPHIYIYMYIYTYTHIHIHIYTPKKNQLHICINMCVCNNSPIFEMHIALGLELPLPPIKTPFFL